MHQPGAGGCGRWVPVPQADKVAPSLNCSVPFAVFSASVCEPRERGIKNHGLEAGTSDHIELCFMLIALEFTQNRLTPTRSDVVLQKSLQSVKKEVKPSASLPAAEEELRLLHCGQKVFEWLNQWLQKKQCFVMP